MQNDYDSQRNTLYFPHGLRLQKEYMPGYGKIELIKTLVATAILSVFNIAYLIISSNMAVCALILLVTISACGMIFIKDTSTNLSAYDMLRINNRFSKAQRHYPYRQCDEWNGENLK